jgi:hypothetical protein
LYRFAAVCLVRQAPGDDALGRSSVGGHGSSIVPIAMSEQPRGDTAQGEVMLGWLGAELGGELSACLKAL